VISPSSSFPPIFTDSTLVERTGTYVYVSARAQENIRARAPTRARRDLVTGIGTAGTLPTLHAIRPTVAPRVEIRDRYWEMNDKSVVFRVSVILLFLFDSGYRDTIIVARRIWHRNQMIFN